VRVAPNRKMTADGWVSPWGGGDGDGGGRKYAGEGHSGSVVGVDERQLAWPCAEESEGEKRRGERDDVRRLFEVEAARQGRGVRLSATWRAGTKKEEGSGARCGTAWLRGVATSRARPNRGGEKGLTSGPRPQCRAATPGDRRARAAQCRAARIQIEFKNSSNGFKFAQTLTNPKGTFPYPKNWKKYGWRDIEIRNNFSYRNFSIFKM
jgi:hypothetical protein